MAFSPIRRNSKSPSPVKNRSRSRSPPPKETVDITNPGNNLYITGLSTRVNEKDLEEYFSREGKVTECRLVTDPRTRLSRGFGFVSMETVEDAERAIKYLHRSTLEGRVITVEKAKRGRARTPTPGVYLGVKTPLPERKGTRLPYGGGSYYGGGGGREGGREGGRGLGGYNNRFREEDYRFLRRSPVYDPYYAAAAYRERSPPRYSPYRGRSPPRYSPYRGRSPPRYSPYRGKSPIYSPYRENRRSYSPVSPRRY